MNKFLSIIIELILMLLLASCGSKEDSSPTTEQNTTISSTTDNKEDDSYMNKKIEFKINNTIVNVYWMDNESVKELKKLASNGLTLNLSEYGGFEQTGLIGYNLPSNDSRLDVVPGDIVLYNSNQISIFYNKSSWSYTKLGHINLSDVELKELLSSKEHITIILTLK